MAVTNIKIATFEMPESSRVLAADGLGFVLSCTRFMCKKVVTLLVHGATFLTIPAHQNIADSM